MRADGSIALFTTDDGKPNGRSVFHEINGKGMLFSFPYGKQTFDDKGFHLLHNSGARIDLGAIGGLPAPLSALSSYLTLGAAAVSVEASGVRLGPRASLAQPVALAPATVAAIAALGSPQST